MEEMLQIVKKRQKTSCPQEMWITKVVHALTVAPKRWFYALTVAHSRINGRAPI